jgi:hypothetical protein
VAVLVLAVLASGCGDAMSTSTADQCGAGIAPQFLRRIAFQHVASSEPRPADAQYVKTTRTGAMSVASEPTATFAEDEPAYLLQISGGRFNHRGLSATVSPSSVLILVVSISREATTDAGYGDQTVDLAPLGPIGQFSLDPACAPDSVASASST